MSAASGSPDERAYTYRQRIKLRNDNHEKRDWYERQRAERRALEVHLYGDSVASELVDASVLKDRDDWRNRTLPAYSARWPTLKQKSGQ